MFSGAKSLIVDIAEIAKSRKVRMDSTRDIFAGPARRERTGTKGTENF